MKQCLDGVLAVAKERQRLSKDPDCWSCGDLNHIRRNCPKAAHFFKPTDGEEGSSKKQGNEKKLVLGDKSQLIEVFQK